MTHADLFSGIGGFGLAARWAGFETKFFCEIDAFCKKVLAKNFPNVPVFDDIKNLDLSKEHGSIDILTGGFPCQPFSTMGKRKGTSDNRSLWGEMFRVVCELSPRFIVAENVSGLLTIEKGMVFEQINLDLGSKGYSVQTYIIPACAQNAPHRRDRVWIIAHSDSLGHKTNDRETFGYHEIGNTPPQKQERRYEQPGLIKSNTFFTNFDGKRPQGQSGLQPEDYPRNYWQREWIEVAPELCRVGNGIPDRVDRLRGLGNAIAPQIAYQIFESIKQSTL